MQSAYQSVSQLLHSNLQLLFLVALEVMIHAQHFRAMQLNFAANSYTDDIWRDLKNDVHVGLSKNCNLECTLTLVNTFFYIHLCVAFWCKEKPKQLWIEAINDYLFFNSNKQLRFFMLWQKKSQKMGKKVEHKLLNIDNKSYSVSNITN